MQEEKTVTMEELVKLVNAQDCDFIIHVMLEGEDTVEEK